MSSGTGARSVADVSEVVQRDATITAKTNTTEGTVELREMEGTVVKVGEAEVIVAVGLMVVGNTRKFEAVFGIREQGNSC